MSTPPVTLDFSKAQPINQPVQLDFSKAQPLDPSITGQTTNDAGATVIVPKDGESIDDTIARAVEHGKTVVNSNGNTTAQGQKEIGAEMKTAPEKAGLALLAAPTMGAAGAMGLAGAGELGSAAVSNATQAIGKIPGLLKSAWDWTTANPVKALVLFKIAEEAGVGTGGLKKILHLVSGSGE